MYANTSQTKNHWMFMIITKKHYIKIKNIQVNFCCTCNKQFYDKSNYSKHLEKKHKINVTEFKNKNYYLIDINTGETPVNPPFYPDTNTKKGVMGGSSPQFEEKHLLYQKPISNYLYYD